MGRFMTLGRTEPMRMKPDERVFHVRLMISGFGEFTMDVPGTDEDDAHDTFMEWLTGDTHATTWRTVTVTIDGRKARLTFPISYVAGFLI